MTDFIVTIQSAKRSSNVKLMENALYPLKPFWIVPESCFYDYEKAGAKNLIGVHGTMPMKVKQLNYALDLGFNENKIVVTLDDDYQFSKEVYLEKDKKKAKNVLLSNLIHNMVNKLERSEFNLAGLDTTTNLFFKGDQEQGHGMVTGQILFHKPNPLRFDENCDFLEDLDYIINHHVNYGGILRYNYYVINFHIYGRSEKENQKYSGGYENLRDMEKQIKILKYLESKYNNEYIKFPEITEVGKSLTRNIKWKKLFTPKNSLTEFL